MQQGLDVRESTDCITIVTPTPGRLRRVALPVFALGMLAFLMAGGFQLLLLMREPDGPGFFLWPLLRHWLFWALLGLLLLLLALDGRSRQKLIWTQDGVRTSWLFGPLELFAHDWQHADLPEIEVRQQQPAGGLEPLFPAEQGEWLLGWRHTDSHGRSGWLIRIARLRSQSEADALRERLLAWKRKPGTPASRAALEPVSELASTSISLLMRLPLVLLLGACIVVIAVAGETLAMQMGKIPAYQAWDREAQAHVSRFAWRLETHSRELHVPEGRAQRDEVHASLQLAVRFQDADGRLQERPLALNLGKDEHGFRLQASGSDGVAIHIEQLAQRGLIPPDLSFEVPRALLPLQLGPDGALRTADIETEPRAEAYTQAYHAHWSVLSQIDRPGVHLPLLWTEASLSPPLRIAYRERDSHDAPVWLATELIELQVQTQNFGGLIYVVALPAVLIGGFMFLLLTPRSLQTAAPILWLVLVASSYYWSAMTPGMAKAIGIDRGLQQRLRDWMTSSNLPEGRPLAALDSNIIAGHWSPEHSRFRELLASLDLLQLPTQRHPDLTSAETAIAGRAMQRMADMSIVQRDHLLRSNSTVSLRIEGNSWLVDAVLTPGYCRWLAEADFGADMRRRFPAAMNTIECPE